MCISIETNRLILRQFTEKDAEAASQNSKQPVVAHYMSDMVLETKEEALKWIKWVNEKKFDIGIPCIVLAVEIKETRTCAGLIGIAPKQELDGEIEILFSLSDEFQNRGYITEAAQTLIEWAFENTKIPYLIAIVKHDNASSNRVISKLGFKYDGERRIDYDGEMTDFHYYKLTPNFNRSSALQSD
ncbi:MAG TPA: GNAT family N-acetyltransferase [Oscillospiraceae bacterium]|nr:GNAT family N-acetyltransferase [Oscillospiraceae bacterium]HPF57078.1 GNAT family N-acetyltransferase [Clostridiales bacterium]HPK36061.1 GNAT family N-acetyltransferase [Oscillospiraceae bacterium]HPR75992.1 GNAT family N-acetyltransferase [Oscillospiraceae bacterium]